MISRNKLDNSFPEGQFLIGVYHVSFIFDCNKNRGGAMFYVREDIHAKLPSHDFTFVEFFY